MDETDVPTQRAQARQDARVPQEDVDEGGPGRDPGAPCEGAPAPVGLIPVPRSGAVARTVGPIRSRRTFEDLRRPSGRGRSGPVSVGFVDRPRWDRSEVAFAVGRNAGNAVQRNLLRRRMRAIVAECADELPTGAYLVRGGPGGPALDFDELKVAMSRALEKATRGTPRRPLVGVDAATGADS